MRLRWLRGLFQRMCVTLLLRRSERGLTRFEVSPCFLHLTPVRRIKLMNCDRNARSMSSRGARRARLVSVNHQRQNAREK